MSLKEPVTMLGDPHGKVVSHVQVELPVFQFLPFASHSIAWQYQEEPGSIL